MKHLDIFSGIGGFALAASEVWGTEHQIVGFCDNDAFCQNVLKKNWPNVPIYGDIRELTADRLASDADHARLEGHRRHDQRSNQLPAWESNRKNDYAIDLLTGGFPCQPFSVAGKQKGHQDDRYLWPEMLRVVRDTQPAYVLGENVAGIVNMALDQVCADLEGEGYAVQPFIVPACAVGAPHRRDRVWIVARRRSSYAEGEQGVRVQFKGLPAHPRTVDERHASNASGKEHRPDVSKGQERKQVSKPSFNRHASSDTALGGRGQERTDAKRGGEGSPAQRSRWLRPASRRDWNRDWREVAASTCHDRVDDGLSERLVRLPDGSEISQARWRREALKAYGNAIVPQVAVEIFKAIKSEML